MTDNVYTDEVTARVVARYNEVRDENYEVRTEVVAAIAEDLGVEATSVRGKLVAEKVYVAKAPTKGTAGASVTKGELAKAVGAVVGADVPTLAKASKADLETLWDFLRTASDQFNADNGVTEPQA